MNQPSQQFPKAMPPLPVKKKEGALPASMPKFPPLPGKVSLELNNPKASEDDDIIIGKRLGTPKSTLE